MNIPKALKKGQVLILVLLTMTVLAIILVSTSTNMIKDTELTQNTNKYETLNAYAERMAFDFGLEFANPQKNNFNVSVFSEIPAAENASSRLKKLLEEAGWKTQNTCELVNNCYSCDIEFDEANINNFIDDNNKIDDQITNPKDLKAVAKICDSKDIKNAEVFKDEILIFDLEGLAKNTIESRNFQIDWESNDRLRDMAMEVSIDFVYSIGAENFYGTTKAIYKASSSNIFNGTLNNGNSDYLKFTNGGENTFRFNLSDFQNSLNTNSGYFKHFHNNNLIINRYTQIRLRPLLKASNPVSVKVSFGTVETPPMDKVQGRSIEILVYEQSQEAKYETSGGFRGSQAIVLSTVPAAKLSGLFDYVLKNDNTL
jgi:hypothetical protein